jgi:S1-C subfamily serine protease
MKAYKIGRNQEADIVLSANYCSRDHALITVSDSGKILLQDFSANGTAVNGKQINNQTIEINYGDEVLFAGIEKLDWSKIERPDTRKTEPPKPAQSNSFLRKHGVKIAGAIIGIALIFFAAPKIKFGAKEPVPVSPTEIYERYKNAVAMVEVKYYIRVHTVANDLYFGYKNGKISPDRLKSSLEPFTSKGTAFFADSNGMLITNHHVIRPWEFDEKLKDYFKTRELPAIKKVLRDKGWENLKTEVYGELEAIYIYTNGKTFSAENRLRCEVHKIAADEDIDLASIKTLSGSLPQGVSIIGQDIVEHDESKIQVNTAAFVIGFPYGDALATNENNELNCSSTSGSFTQAPAKNYVQYSAETAGGGSGSPVFNQYGKLVAVTYRGTTTGQSFNRGILAKYLKDVQ